MAPVRGKGHGRGGRGGGGGRGGRGAAKRGRADAAEVAPEGQHIAIVGLPRLAKVWGEPAANKDYLGKVDRAKAAILTAPVVQDTMTALPQQIDEGADEVDCGCKVVYDSIEFKITMKVEGRYEAAFNVFAWNIRRAIPKIAPLHNCGAQPIWSSNSSQCRAATRSI